MPDVDLDLDRDLNVETLDLPDGRTLAYATYGREDGTSLVFHHGVPGSCVLGAVLSYTARQRGVRVIAPSRPGYGRSDPHPDGTLETWAADCQYLADELGLESFAVAGFSGGGPPALAVADRFPDRVTAAGIVSAPVPESEGPLASLARFPRLLDIALRCSRLLAQRRGDPFVVDQLTERDLDDVTAQLVGHDFRTGLAGRPSGAVRETRFLAGDWSLPDPEPAIETTAWHGTADSNVPLEPVERVYADRSDVTFRTVENDHLGTLLSVREELVTIAT
ncbi:alpha/beta fold hydrolase [Halopiger aswanensis]|uniref:Pimeloyl-ACP methyl ester carboxylesterase n=1 Tax=Halopiger aswanensis TaxID=148449 RepID=A0A419WDN5_9EURY|nr:alpha/beta hydrolase [Halopiger aswanensis]RKD93512.1 pimeloyl-ACP methyl ester carboxylesterase [Halopiger aswanensis]